MELKHVGLICLTLLPAVIRVIRGRQAGRAPRKIAGEAIPALFMPVLAVALLRPLPGAANYVLLAIAAVLFVWDIAKDVRDWRRSRAGVGPD